MPLPGIPGGEIQHQEGTETCRICQTGLKKVVTLSCISRTQSTVSNIGVMNAYRFLLD